MEKLKGQLKIYRLRLCYARLQIHETKANFNPNQPRVPPGNSQGGEWTATNQSGSNDAVPSLGKAPQKIDLHTEENYRGAHTLRYHVGKTGTELLLRIGRPAKWWMPVTFVMFRNGSFNSYEDAQYFVNQTIASNTETVNLVATGLLKDAFLKKRFGYRTGIEAFRETPYSEAHLRVTYEVGVFIVYDASRPNGFYVNTAYPRNDDIVKKTVTATPVFLKFTSYMIQDFEIFESLDGVLLFGLYHLTETERNELRTFLESILRPDVPDRALGNLWSTSNAEFGAADQGIKWLLNRTVELIERDDGTNNYYQRRS